MEERLHKFLAHSGVASRRASEELILAGRVRVDGRTVTELGVKVDPEKSVIQIDGKKIAGRERQVYILLYKPVGYVSTVRDPEGRPTVLDLITGVEERLYPVGRLDFDTSGLLILTNDGELTNDLIHPSREVRKTYRALVKGVPDGQVLAQLKSGVDLEDGKTAPAQLAVRRIIKTNALIDMTIHEGKKRQVRRMLAAVGHPVLWLKRISFSFLDLGKMNPGEWRYLTSQEVARLKSDEKTRLRFRRTAHNK